MPSIAESRAAALRAYTPPPRVPLSTWIEEHLVLPAGTSALPGIVRLYPYQREIADAIGDPLLERVTLVKPVRVGFTMTLVGALAGFVANDPCPVLALLPTESDARDFIVSDVEPTFAASPAVAGALEDDSKVGERNTLLHRRFPGGSLKAVAAKAPRNLRRHTVRVLLIDEADAMEVGPEGSPITLAERRTLSFPDRKIVLGSTPLEEETSHVLRAYGRSDQRVYEIPCPACGTFTAPRWAHIVWDEGRPETAAFECPGCHARIPETAKPAMVAAGRWRATRSEVTGHAGFKLNALVSSLAHAAWGKLAEEFLRAKDDPAELQVFVNTILAEGWRETTIEVDYEAIAARAEPFGLEAIPAEVLFLTAGTDVQDDRLETTLVGWTKDEPLVLAHLVLWGNPDDEAPWKELDAVLQTWHPHPLGGKLRVDAAIVDSSDRPDRVYPFCFPRSSRRVWAGKGVAGSRPICEGSKSKVRGGRLFLVGVDTIKATIMSRLAHGRKLRFSNTLEASYYEGLASEKKVVRYVRGQPIRRWERIKGIANEPLDCLVYNFAARHMLSIPIETRAAELAQGATPAGTNRARLPSWEFGR